MLAANTVAVVLIRMIERLDGSSCGGHRSPVPDSNSKAYTSPDKSWCSKISESACNFVHSAIIAALSLIAGLTWQQVGHIGAGIAAVAVLWHLCALIASWFYVFQPHNVSASLRMHSSYLLLVLLLAKGAPLAWSYMCNYISGAPTLPEALGPPLALAPDYQDFDWPLQAVVSPLCARFAVSLHL